MNPMPMDGDILSHQAVLELHDNLVALLGLNRWSRRLPIDGDYQFLVTIRRLVLILHLPLVIPDCRLRRWNREQREKEKQSHQVKLMPHGFKIELNEMGCSQIVFSVDGFDA